MLQVQAEAAATFDSIVQRQALIGKARQEQQLAAQFTSVLGFSARLRAFCQSRQYSQILPAYEQASAFIQSQIQATPDDSHVDWGVLQTLVNQVSCASKCPLCITVQSATGVSECLSTLYLSICHKHCSTTAFQKQGQSTHSFVFQCIVLCS